MRQDALKHVHTNLNKVTSTHSVSTMYHDTCVEKIAATEYNTHAH